MIGGLHQTMVSCTKTRADMVDIDSGFQQYNTITG